MPSKVNVNDYDSLQSPCDNGDCGKDTGTIVKSARKRKRPLVNKKGWMWIAPIKWEKCSNDRIIAKNNVFPNDYYIPENLSDLDIDMQQQQKEENVSNSPMPLHEVTGYKGKIDFKTVWTESGAWRDFLEKYTFDLPMGDEAEVDVMFPRRFVNPVINEKGRIVSADAIAFGHFTGPLDIKKYLFSGGSENLSDTSATINVNYRWDEVILTPKNKGDWDKLIEAMNGSKGIDTVWDNDCVTKIIDVK